MKYLVQVTNLNPPVDCQKLSVLGSKIVEKETRRGRIYSTPTH